MRLTALIGGGSDEPVLVPNEGRQRGYRGGRHRGGDRDAQDPVHVLNEVDRDPSGLISGAGEERRSTDEVLRAERLRQGTRGGERRFIEALGYIRVRQQDNRCALELRPILGAKRGMVDRPGRRITMEVRVDLCGVRLKVAVLHDAAIEGEVRHRRVQHFPRRADQSGAFGPKLQATGAISRHDLRVLDRFNDLVEVHSLIDFLRPAATQATEVIDFDNERKEIRMNVAAQIGERDLRTREVDRNWTVSPRYDVLRIFNHSLLEDRLTGLR